MPGHYQSALPIGLFVTMLVVTTYWQDSLTFGYLQGALEAKFTRSKAAMIVAISFFAGHAIFIPFAPNALQAVLQMPLIVAAAAVLSVSRLATRSIYLSNAIHLAYLLAFS